VVLLGPGSGREGSARVGAIVLSGGAGTTGVTINTPGFGSQFGSSGAWGTPVRYTPEMINALQSRLDTPITGKGPGAVAQGQGAGSGGRPGISPGPTLDGTSQAAVLASLTSLQEQSSIVAATGAQDQQRCEDTGACPGIPGVNGSMTTSGNSTFEQLRTVASGTFFYSASGTPLSDGGSYDILANINFGNRTIGGGDSRVDVNGSTVGGTVSILTQSFASGSGTATFTQSGISGLSGALCSPSCTTSISLTPQNSGGVVGATANHSVSITGSGTVSGSGAATRQIGSAPPPG
jgi:hypothetical protein